MNAERLFCRCGIEVAVVRLNATTLTFGHRQNPKDKHHLVRLAPAARNDRPARSTGQPEGSELVPGRETPDANGHRAERVAADPRSSAAPNPQRRGRARAPSTVRSSERAATSPLSAGALNNRRGTAG